jgi:2-polyprenyl-3-methyl-5-hydroxy-6-metoxy-1,4-benzoquinol methylase/uncharacterized protein YbaR (Trm112 family)
MDDWLQTHLVCPRDHLKLQMSGNTLTCPAGHTYPCVDDIPVMLLTEVPPTHNVFGDTLKQVAASQQWSQYAEGSCSQDAVDPYVQQIIVGTCGNLYRPLLNRLPRYPIPDLRLPSESEKHLLEVGCNWGRWCISAAQKGYHPVGIDPSLEAVAAARRVARQLGVHVTYLVADARYLPFAPGSFDVVFSYSVLQHLDKNDVRLCLAEMAQVLKPAGTSLVQMPNAFGLRNLYLQLRKGFKESGFFCVRYWRPSELRHTFSSYIGPTTLSVDSYFSLNAQASDKDLLPRKFRLVVAFSDMLRRLSQRIPGLLYLADSLYIHSIRESR